jgi:hypothetical protein
MTTPHIEAGTTSEAAVLARYEAAHLAHETAKADQTDTESFGTKATMLAGGAIVGIGAGTLVAMMSNLTGTVSTNPAVALALGVGLVAGVAAGAVFNKVSSHCAQRDVVATQQQFEGAEQQAFAMPSLKGRLEARREAVAAQVAQDQADLKAQRVAAAVIGFGIGTITGR